MIVSAYLTRNKGPRQKVHPNEDVRIKLWSESVEALGLQGVIFHDQLTEDFVERHSSPHVEFLKVARPYVATPNDMRFFLFREILEERRPSYAFMTDLWDVWLTENPYKKAKPGKVYVGYFDRKLEGARVAKGHATQTGSEKMLRLFEDHSQELMMNAWVVGGERSILTMFLDRFIELHKELEQPGRNLNNLLVNYLTHVDFREESSTELSKMDRCTRAPSAPFVHGHSWIPKHMDYIRRTLK